MKLRLIVFVSLLFCFWQKSIQACTVFSAKDKKGHVWVGNNEDFYFTFNTYLNIVKGSDSTFGYIYFSYFTPMGHAQGGMNEAGLFFDGHAVKPSVYKDFDKKKDFPGDSRAMLWHVLGKCRTVHEAFRLFKEYRLPGLEAGQLHLADKEGNFGIIVADSMWITKDNYQVSTNYNLCHPDKDGIDCWRFPIADNILKTSEPGFEVFREICDSTSRKSISSTLYSNIQDLNTGDIWFFYGMDYENHLKTNIKDLLKRGTTSIYLYELFGEAPLVASYKTYLAAGADESLNKLESYQITAGRKNEILRLLSNDLLLMNRDLKAHPILRAYILNKKRPDDFNFAASAICLYCLNKKDEAIEALKKYISSNPKSILSREVLNQIEGNSDELANARFELKGYSDAAYVFVNEISITPLFNFMVKSSDKWIGNFRLPPGAHLYNFSVNGERMLDPGNNDIVTVGGIEYNRLIIKN